MTKRLNNNILKSIEDIDLKETNLSIQIYLDGFSFCVYSPTTKEHLAFQRFEFNEKAITPEKLLLEVQGIFENNELLNQNYNKVVVIHQNELATVVPQIFFDENNLKDYLKHSVKVLSIDFISYDSLQYSEANVVYIPFVNINNFLFQKFGEFDYYHSSTLLINLLQEKQENSDRSKVYINVCQNSFDLIAFDKKELLFYNSFDFQSSEDFIYYILFTFEQLKLDPNSIEIELLGDIEKDSELFDNAYKYIRNISFFNQTNLSEINHTESAHSNFILFNHIE